MATSLSARSIIASTLLGTHPPELPGRLLVALAAKFGVSEGAARVALSRMVDRGELTNSDAVYRLAGHLLDRQRRQDTSLVGAQHPWDGRWDQAVVLGPAEPGHRSARRASLAALKMAELREGVWLRPANLDPQRLPDEPVRAAADLLWAHVVVADGAELAARLWDLAGWARTATELTAAMTAAGEQLAKDDDDALAPGFELSAAVLRHFVADPQLPESLLPDDWPGSGLRAAYRDFDEQYRAHLRRFFRAQR